jgi:predicted metal-dependent phosphoesterase TrpH
MLPVRTTVGKIKPDGWYRGEMHCHTYHSDGDSDPLDVVRKAEALGLDFLAITDHNNLSHLVRLNTIETRLILIPGLEVTTYKGHWNIWGDQGWIDFRIEDEAQMAEAVAEAKRRGYVTSLNHPRPYGPDWVYPAVDSHHCIEVWNGPWALFNDVALEFWESRLRQGKRYTAVGGSDSHFHKREHPAQFAHPTLWIYCEGAPSAPKLLDAIRAGHVAISESPSGARLTLNAGSAMMGDSVPRPADGRLALSLTVKNGSGEQLELRTAAGCVHSEMVTGDNYDIEIEVDVSSTPYVRAQLVNDREQARPVQALTNPIYLA